MLNTTEIFLAEGHLASAVVGAAAYTDLTGAAGGAGLVLLITGKPGGTLISLLAAKATEATTAGMLYFFLQDAAGGPKRLRWQLPVTATPISTSSTPSFEGEIDLTETAASPAASGGSGFRLPENAKIWVGSHVNGELINVFADGETYELSPATG